jgi:hypothetical protein
MQYAFWIAIAVVFIAIAPTFFKRRKTGEAEPREGGERQDVDAGSGGNADQA